MKTRASGQIVGGAVEATDTDRNRLTYSTRRARQADSFTIVSSSGQIRTRAALNYESRQRYLLTVKVDDGQKKRQQRRLSSRWPSLSITSDERPSAPVCTAKVTGIAGSTRQRPSHMGRASEHGASHHRLRRALPRGLERMPR